VLKVGKASILVDIEGEEHWSQVVVPLEDLAVEDPGSEWFAISDMNDEDDDEERTVLDQEIPEPVDRDVEPSMDGAMVSPLGDAGTDGSLNSLVSPDSPMEYTDDSHDQSHGKEHGSLAEDLGDHFQEEEQRDTPVGSSYETARTRLLPPIGLEEMHDKHSSRVESLAPESAAEANSHDEEQARDIEDVLEAADDRRKAGDEIRETALMRGTSSESGSWFSKFLEWLRRLFH
jgi:hypothetical protein